MLFHLWISEEHFPPILWITDKFFLIKVVNSVDVSLQQHRLAGVVNGCARHTRSQSSWMRGIFSHLTWQDDGRHTAHKTNATLFLLSQI